jgi:hypothetical protein
MKLFRSKGGNSAYSQMMLGDEQAAMQESAASKFGEAVSDGISQKVVMLTLTLLIVVPFFIPAVVPAKHEAIDIIEVGPYCALGVGRCVAALTYPRHCRLFRTNNCWILLPTTTAPLLTSRTLRMHS